MVLNIQMYTDFQQTEFKYQIMTFDCCWAVVFFISLISFSAMFYSTRH